MNATYKQWGDDIDSESIQQMDNACRLPVSVRGALMPDAHVGYGLPIGGVLAARNAVIPYAVGMDIACRMKMSVLDLPLTMFDKPEPLIKALEKETAFGVGAAFKKSRRKHSVMDEDWSVSPVTKKVKDKAWSQLGTSGSGNHFVEFGVLTVTDNGLGVEPRNYLALLSHSGSRGAGGIIAQHYTKLAKSLRRDIEKHLTHLAWFDLDTEEGEEYWAAMQLMGLYSAANHNLIHHHVSKHLGAEVLVEIDNHHNFAWKEIYDNEELVVHRKGATPAANGVLGLIPGSMATAAYVVRGKGNVESLNSSSHGAGRKMSRKKAKEAFKWSDIQDLLKTNKVTLLSAGIDEAPMAYKDIETVMAAQSDLVDTVGRFLPRLVKMAPAGERPED